MGCGLGSFRRRVNGCDRAEEHQWWWGKGEEEVQTRESEQHPGERGIPLAKMSNCVWKPNCNHGHDVLCNRIKMSALQRLQKCNCRLATIQRMRVIGVCTDDGKCVGQSKTEIAQKET